MPTLTYKKGDWYIINLSHATAVEERELIKYMNNHKEDIIWLINPRENILKWKYRKEKSHD